MSSSLRHRAQVARHEKALGIEIVHETAREMWRGMAHEMAHMKNGGTVHGLVHEMAHVKGLSAP